MLQITTKLAQIGINTHNAKLNIQQPKGELAIKQAPKPEMKIERELPKVIIDQYQCFAEAGLKNPTDLRKDIAQWSRKKWLEGIARRNEEGEMLSRIENGGNPIADIGENNAYPTYDFNIDYIPKSRPKIDIKGHLNIQWDIKKAEINYQPQKPIVNYTPGDVEIYIQQWNDIEINFVDEKV